MRLSPILLASLLSTAVPAQIQLPDYARTYTASATRGYYFTAPEALVVTHLQVPDELPSTNAGDGQIVALYKLSAPPPAFSNTMKASPVFYTDSVPSGQRIALTSPAVYAKGDVVLVLGAMGQTTGTIRNSYGSSAYTGRVLGTSLPLHRAGMQVSIASNKGVGDIYGIAGGTISRIRMWVASHGAGVQYGVGAKGAELDYSDPNPPSIGQTGGVIIRSDDASNTGSALSIGILRLNVPSPWNGNLLSTPTLFLLITPGKMTTGRGAGSGHRYTFPIANNNSLLGAKLTMQGAVGGAAGLKLTNGMEWVIGR